MFDASILLSIISFLLVLLHVILTKIRRPSRFPPGPAWLPVVGNSSLIKQLSIRYGGFHNALNNLANSYKTPILGLKLGGELFVVVFSKDLVKQIFTREDFQARPDSYFIRLRTMGSRKGITMTDGSFWQEQRSFAVKHLRSLGFGKSHMESLIIEELKDLLDTLRTKGPDVSLSDHLAPCVLNVLWALTAGHRFLPSDPQLTRLLELMARRSKAFDMSGGVLSQFPFLAYIAPEWSGYNLICSLNNELKTLLEKTINEHKQSFDNSKTRDFIDAYLNEIGTSNGHSTSFTEEQLIMVCLDFFIAGSQTTSNTLAFAFLHMVLNQDIQERVYLEIKDVLGDRKYPSLEDKISLPFVEAVLTESQRFLHVVPVAGPRRVLCDTELEDYKIPKGSKYKHFYSQPILPSHSLYPKKPLDEMCWSKQIEESRNMMTGPIPIRSTGHTLEDSTILLSLHSVHHDESIWEDPNKFNPDRFMVNANRKLMDEMYQFGLGKRRCLGEALAKNFIFLFFTGILRNFCVGVKNGTDPPKFDFIPGITLSPKPYHVKLTPRQE